MLSRVTAKNVGDVFFWDTLYICYYNQHPSSYTQGSKLTSFLPKTTGLRDGSKIPKPCCLGLVKVLKHTIKISKSSAQQWHSPQHTNSVSAPTWYPPDCLQNTSLLPVRTVPDLGVYTDADVTMSAHVTAIVKACFAALHQIGSVRRSLTCTTLLTLVHALMVTKLDYCSSVLSGHFWTTVTMAAVCLQRRRSSHVLGEQ